MKILSYFVFRSWPDCLASIGLSGAFISSCLLPVALADAPTHMLTLDAQSQETDCAGGACSRVCSVKATLSNVKSRSSVPIEIAIWYVNSNTDSGEAAVSLYFGSLAKGEKRDTEDETPGYDCKHVIVKRIEVVCPEQREEKCPSFYNIAVPAYPALKIKRQDVEGK